MLHKHLYADIQPLGLDKNQAVDEFTTLVEAEEEAEEEVGREDTDDIYDTDDTYDTDDSYHTDDDDPSFPF